MIDLIHVVIVLALLSIFIWAIIRGATHEEKPKENLDDFRKRYYEEVVKKMNDYQLAAAADLLTLEIRRRHLAVDRLRR